MRYFSRMAPQGVPDAQGFALSIFGGHKDHANDVDNRQAKATKPI
jgi:hypothetical protein